MQSDIHKNHNLWIRYANRLCKDKDLAKDLVQDMYLKLLPVENKLHVKYVYKVISNAYLDKVKYKKKFSSVDLDSCLRFSSELDNGGYNDEELKALDNFKNANWYRKTLLEEKANGKSIRQIAEEYNVCYGWVFREINIARENILK